MSLQTFSAPRSVGFLELLSQGLDFLRSAQMASIDSQEVSTTRHQFALEMVASNSGSFAGDLDAQNMMEQFSGRL